jgi:GTP cyclohydrolase I
MDNNNGNEKHFTNTQINGEKTQFLYTHKDPKIEKIANLTRQILDIINPDSETEIIKKTPIRYAEALTEFTSGYNENLDEKITKAIFNIDEYDDIIIIKDINFTSMCEHHILPFFGQVNIGYIPNKKILGLSKFPRMVQILSKKLHLQERLTKEIVDNIQKYLDPAGVVVHIEACHSCMCFRGVKSFDSKTVTLYSIGVMKEQQNQDKFLTLIKK